MKVVILCGGLGTRLREETEFRPKPMVNIGSRPILWHIMKIYAHYGFRDFVLALGYKGEIIKQYFTQYEVMNNDVTIHLGRPDEMLIHKQHSECGWKITLANTGEKTLKGARLKRVEQYLDEETFMLTYGDGVSDVNLRELLEFHHSHGKMATLTGINPVSQFGELKISGEKVEAVFEKPINGSVMVNGGYFVFNREFLNYLSRDDDCDLEIGALENIAARGELMVYKHKGFWACMDTLRDTERLNKLWNDGKAAWKIW